MRLGYWIGMAGALWLSACDEQQASLSSPCTPQQVMECPCPDGSTGQQSCAADGASFSACTCAVVAATSSAQESPTRPLTPATSVEESPPPPALVLEVLVGAECEADDDCGPGLLCLTSASGGFFGRGGPARGYCTAACSTQTQGCQELDPASYCALTNGQAWCVRQCLSQDPDPGERKCLDRPDLACLSVAAAGQAFLSSTRQDGVCVPLCTGDGACGGRFCDPGSGLCVDEPPAEPGLGLPCDEADDCAGGVCEPVRDGTGVCSQRCKFGGIAGCGFANADEPQGAACLVPYVALSHFSEGEGDLGVCRELCDQDSDCVLAAEGWSCRSSELVQGRFGRVGACGPPPPPAPDAAAAPADAGVEP